MKPSPYGARNNCGREAAHRALVLSPAQNMHIHQLLLQDSSAPGNVRPTADGSGCCCRHRCIVLGCVPGAFPEQVFIKLAVCAC